jgi:hypothetical protein
MRFCFPVCVALFLFGCASTQTRIEPAQLAALERGKTTVADVMGRFGRPTVMSKNMDGSQTAAYMQAAGRSEMSGFVPLMTSIVTEREASVASVTFYFDANGVLTSYRTTEPREAAPQSASATPDAPAAQSPQAARDASSSQPVTDAAGAAQRPASPKRAEAKSGPLDPSPWTIQLNPSGYRENR